MIFCSDAGNGYYVEKNALYANYEKSLGRVNLVELIKLSEQSEFNKKINLKASLNLKYWGINTREESSKP